MRKATFGVSLSVRILSVSLGLVLLVGIDSTAFAQRLMAPGIEVPSETRDLLESKLNVLEVKIEALGKSSDGGVIELIPDVEIFSKAVRSALDYDEFIRNSEFQIAEQLLDQGLSRAAQLEKGLSPWATETGLVVRGYRSRIDDSVQPYGLVIPDGYSVRGHDRYRADVWLHGRDNRLTELKFLHQRQSLPGQFVPKNTFVLHPYGRFCNAFKFAGEVDVFESLEAVKQRYRIDEQRVAIRGFSMGGAGCWHLAVHHPDVWVAAAPGAGFAESAEYLGLWRKESKPTWYQQELWHLYDATDYALNLYHNPTVAYSGEIDKQIQAAQVMAKALEEEGMKLRHVIGPKTAHSYHPLAKKEVASRIDSIVRIGKERIPRHLKFTTWTLRYARSHWIELHGLGQHWRRAKAEGWIQADDQLRLDLTNVTSLTLRFDSGESPFSAGAKPLIRINGTTLQGPAVKSDRSWQVFLAVRDGAWRVVAKFDEAVIQKRPGLQGPIDDAFMDRFILVEPSRPLAKTYAGQWIGNELKRFKHEWRGQFRGQARSVKADQLTEKQIARCNLILWGDPASNSVINAIESKLPIQWDNGRILFAGHVYDGTNIVPSFVYPNPLNPNRYIVINSGFTFRGYGSNATQVPMLPDYAFVDVRTPADQSVPGKIVEAGFFNEHWQSND